MRKINLKCIKNKIRHDGNDIQQYGSMLTVSSIITTKWYTNVKCNEIFKLCFNLFIYNFSLHQSHVAVAYVVTVSLNLSLGSQLHQEKFIKSIILNKNK